MEFDYYLIDAFTTEAFQGAPIAVFPNAQNMSLSDMQKIARELNQTETVFILPAVAEQSFELKIFTPECEIEFGGHPVIAASYALFNNNMIAAGSNKLNMTIGSIDIFVDDNQKIQFSIKAEAKLDNFVPSAKELSDILGLDESDLNLNEYASMISGYGDDYLIVPVKSLEKINKAHFREDKWTMSFVATLAKQIILFCKNRDDSEVDYNARLFGKGIAYNDDPPIGTSVPAFGNYIFAEAGKGIHSAIVQRGGDGRRASKIEVEVHRDTGQVSEISVGGFAVQVGEGKIYL